MSLIELWMALGVFLTAGACSLQLWISSARATQQLDAEQRLLLQMDGQLLRLRASWLQAASTQAKPILCRGATEWMLQDPPCPLYTTDASQEKRRVDIWCYT